MVKFDIHHLWNSKFSTFLPVLAQCVIFGTRCKDLPDLTASHARTSTTATHRLNGQDTKTMRGARRPPEVKKKLPRGARRPYKVKRRPYKVTEDHER